jgi:hypothetical protein
MPVPRQIAVDAALFANGRRIFDPDAWRFSPGRNSLCPADRHLSKTKYP